MSDSNTNNSGPVGVSLGGLVFLVFLILKLAEIGVVASWPWWAVTAPLWGPLVVVLGVLAVAGIFILIARFLDR